MSELDVDLFRWLLGILVVAGALFGLSLFLKSRFLPNDSSDVPKVLSRVAIGRQQELIVISFRDEVFLLAATKNSISKVHSFDSDAEPQESETTSF